MKTIFFEDGCFLLMPIFIMAPIIIFDIELSRYSLEREIGGLSIALLAASLLSGIIGVILELRKASSDPLRTLVISGVMIATTLVATLILILIWIARFSIG